MIGQETKYAEGVLLFKEFNTTSPKGLQDVLPLCRSESRVLVLSLMTSSSNPKVHGSSPASPWISEVKRSRDLRCLAHRVSF